MEKRTCRVLDRAAKKTLGVYLPTMHVVSCDLCTCAQYSALARALHRAALDPHSLDHPSCAQPGGTEEVMTLCAFTGLSEALSEWRS